jgi:hypothetical protein
MNYTKEEVETALEVEKIMLEKDTPNELKSVFAAGKIIGFKSKPNSDELFEIIRHWADDIRLPMGFDGDLYELYKRIDAVLPS